MLLRSSSDGEVSSTDSGKSLSSSVLGANPLVLSRLCRPGQQRGKELLAKFRSVRHNLQKGTANIGYVREEARAARGMLWDLQSLLSDMMHDVQQHNSIDFVQEGKMSQADWDRESALLDACAKWLQRAEAVVGEADHEVEALLQREGHASMAPEWVTFVNKTVHLLREIEQVIHNGQVQAQYCSGLDPQSKQRCLINPRSRLSYKDYWANKIAL